MKKGDLVFNKLSNKYAQVTEVDKWGNPIEINENGVLIKVDSRFLRLLGIFEKIYVLVKELIKSLKNL